MNYITFTNKCQNLIQTIIVYFWHFSAYICYMYAHVMGVQPERRYIACEALPYCMRSVQCLTGEVCPTGEVLSGSAIMI